LAFGVEIDKDVVRRILSVHYRPTSDSGGPAHHGSWVRPSPDFPTPIVGSPTGFHR
jgi:hypothetical protein